MDQGQLESLFEKALAFPSADSRAGFLDEACRGQPELRTRLNLLLEGHFMAKGFLEGSAKTRRVLVPADEQVGTTIGRYKILERIGEGGFGVVYLAEQREPVKRRVALKIIKPGMDSKQVVARFEAERQALALMDHPGIAQVFDGGETASGRPYFVMELVRGVPITAYCEEHKLSASERLQLFVQVCEAVQHAHQKGIIHRDLKPSNVLVTVNDGRAVPKVIDFGIAKATQLELTDKTVFTQFHHFIGTPAYVSPEQALLTSVDIDTRSDIYALGVLLYELLTGKTPFDGKELVASGLDEMRRIIREVEPVRPSTRLARERRSKSEIPPAVTPRQLGENSQAEIKSALRTPHSAIPSDLDWIVMKCLEKDRARRYATSSGLAADILRHLNNEPVVARPPSRLYRFQKSVQRNKLAFAATAAIASALLLGAVASTWQAVRVTRARERAEVTNRFLEKLLRQATPDANASEEARMAMTGILITAVAELEHNGDIASRPELEAALRLSVGNTFYKLGVLDRAETNLRRAATLRRSVLGRQHRDTLAAQAALAKLLVFGLKRFEEGESLSRETWQAQRQLLGPEHRDTLDSLTAYFWALSDQGRAATAEPFARECLDACERSLGSDKMETIDALGNLGHVLAMRGDYVEAERCERESLIRFQRAGLADKEGAFYSVNNLAGYQLMLDRPEQAETVLTNALPRAVRIFGPEYPLTLQLQQMLARVLEAEGRLEAAAALADQTLAARRRVTPRHESLGRTLLILGRVRVQRGQLDEAELRLREARDLFRELCPGKPELAAQASNWLGATQLARRDFASAETLLLPDAEAMLAPTAGISAAELRPAINHIVVLCQALGKSGEAAAWQKKVDALSKRPANVNSQ